MPSFPPALISISSAARPVSCTKPHETAMPRTSPPRPGPRRGHPVGRPARPSPRLRFCQLAPAQGRSGTPPRCPRRFPDRRSGRPDRRPVPRPPPPAARPGRGAGRAARARPGDRAGPRHRRQPRHSPPHVRRGEGNDQEPGRPRPAAGPHPAWRPPAARQGHRRGDRADPPDRTGARSTKKSSAGYGAPTTRMRHRHRRGGQPGARRRHSARSPW